MLLSYPASFSAAFSKCDFPHHLECLFLVPAIFVSISVCVNLNDFVSGLSVPLPFYFCNSSHSPSFISVQVNWRKKKNPFHLYNLVIQNLFHCLRLSFLNFILCLTVLWLLMTFAAVSILYWWPESRIHLTSSFFGFVSSKCCYLFDPVPVCMMPQNQRGLRKLLRHKHNSTVWSVVFLLWGSVFSFAVFVSSWFQSVFSWLWRMLLSDHCPCNW